MLGEQEMVNLVTCALKFDEIRVANRRGNFFLHPMFSFCIPYFLSFQLCVEINRKEYCKICFCVLVIALDCTICIFRTIRRTHYTRNIN